MYRRRVGRLVVLLALTAGCASSSAIGIASTKASGGGSGFTITANSEIGMRIGENLELGLTSNMHFANWSRAANAYGKLNEWARDGAVDCCGGAGPLITIFKYFGLGMGYLSAWVLATDALMTGPRLRFYVNQYAPTFYIDAGVGPAVFFPEGADGAAGIGGTAAVGYMFNPYIGVELRTTMGNVNDPQWATFSVGLVAKPKKRFFGLFGRNDLERPKPSEQPPQPITPQPMTPQPMPPPMPPQSSPQPVPPQPAGPPGTTPPS